MRQETDYVLHHAQKILAIFAGMRDLARQLQALGHRVHYLRIDDPDNCQSLDANLRELIVHCGAKHLDYQDPDQWRLDAQIKAFSASSPDNHCVTSNQVDSEHFYTQRHEAAALFAERKQWLMEHFYRHIRQRHRVLIDDANKSAGGQ